MIGAGMRFVGGASVGLLAGLAGCWPMPPPDPGRPPPPPEMLPAPPPDPAPAAAAARKRSPKTKAPEEPEPRLVWDPSARTLRCGDGVALPVPAELAVYVRTNGGSEIIVAPPGSPPGAALIAMTIGADVSEWFSLGDPEAMKRLAALEEQRDRTRADVIEAFERLRLMASAKGFVEGGHGGDMRTGDDGIQDLVFVDERAPDTVWRMVVAHAATCLFMGIEQVRPDAAQRFFPMLERMCAANKSRCREPSSTSPAGR